MGLNLQASRYNRTKLFLAVGTLIATAPFGAVLLAQSVQRTGAAGRKSIASNPTEVKEGASLFRANCSPCHGLNARGGGRGPDLTSGRWVHGSTDDAIFRTITQGVPGTEIPANSFEDSMTWAIVAYLRSLSPLSEPSVAGDRAKGEQVFLGKGACSQCHMVSGRGGDLGPNLTRVGAREKGASWTRSTPIGVIVC